MCQEFNKYWIQNQKSAYEMIKEVVDEQGIKLKENNMEDKNKTAAELITDLQNELDRANKDNNDIQFRNRHLEYENRCLRQDINEYAKDLDKEKKKYQRATEKITQLKEESNALHDMIDYLEDELITEKVNNTKNDDMSKEITKWHSKYAKEKAKHDKATKMIDELKKHQKDELAWSDKRRRDNIDSLLYSYWGLKEYYQETKCNKNEANDKRREMKHAKDYGWFQYDSLDKWRLF